MKEISLPARMHLLANRALDAMTQPVEESNRPNRQASKNTEGRSVRKEFFLYQPIIDQDTQGLVGHLADISIGGFKLDCQSPIPVNRDFRFGMSLDIEFSEKQFMTFIARSRWCKVDPLDPYVYNVGFQLVNISREDLKIFNHMMEKYGRETKKSSIELRRSNKW